MTARGNHAKIKSVEVNGRPHGALQDRRAVSALRRAPDRPVDPVREGDAREGPRVDAGEPGRHRALQARQVEPEAGASPGPERRLLGSEAPFQVRAHPDHPRAGHADRRAALRRRGHHEGGAAGPDGRHQQVGRGAHRDVADPPDGVCQARPAGPGRAEKPDEDRRVRQAANLAVDTDASSSTSSTGWATAWPPASIPWPSGGTRASSPTSRTSPRPRSSSPRPASQRRGHCLPRVPARSWSPPSSRPTTPSWPTWPRPVSA